MTPCEGGLARLRAELAANKPTLLILHVQDEEESARYAALLRAVARRRVNVLTGVLADGGMILSGPTEQPSSATLGAEPEVLAKALRSLTVARLDVLTSSAIHGPTERLLEVLGVPYDITFLDAPEGRPSNSIVAAERWIAATRDVASRMREIAPLLQVRPAEIPEPNAPARFQVKRPPLHEDEPLRVLAPDAPSATVSEKLIGEAAALIRSRNLPIRLYLLPSKSLPPDLRLGGDARVVTLGAWRRELANTLSCALRPHLAWLPSQSGSTGYGFVLSDMMHQGLPILASAIGSYPERLEGRRMSWVLPPGSDALAWIEAMLKVREDRLGEEAKPQAKPDAPTVLPGYYQRDYLAPLLSAAKSAA